jgi:hypothetical protein
MKNTLKPITLGLVSSLMLVAPAAAAKPAGHGGGGGGTPSPTVLTGNDVSWPQCSRHMSLPSGQAFGIVGVNGGLANTTNPCLSQELSWANASKGGTNQPKTALYVNTANPGDVTPTVADWPKNNIDVVTGAIDNDPYGTCTGANDMACAWQYGYNMANLDFNSRGVTTPGIYTWYLDVEVGNSWTTDQAKNAADLEGMVAYLNGVKGAKVGLYSTNYQWQQIAGTVDTASSLNGLPSWLPGASSVSGAQANCTLPGLTANSQVVLAQYVSKNTDYDVSCIQ